MSNKIVPTIYRAIIDDVIASIKSEFDAFGIGEDVLADLQSRWESKVVQSRVADFEPTPQSTVPHSYPATLHPPHTGTPHHTPYAGSAYIQQSQTQVKSEPVDGQFPSAYTPPLPGPQLNGVNRSGVSQVPPAGYATMPPPIPRAYPNQPQASALTPNGQPPSRIPQVDGPSSSSSVSPSPPPSQSYAPRTSHPSLPQPTSSKETKPVVDSEEINSDLDDSDSEAEEDEQEGSVGDTDIVFCTYDKVARVKNKWKCVLKDGMIHVNGKDYLFAKCTCEFEW